MPFLHSASEDYDFRVTNSEQIVLKPSIWVPEKDFPMHAGQRKCQEFKSSHLGGPCRSGPSGHSTPSMKRKTVRSLPTPESSPERPSRKKHVANGLVGTVFATYPTPPQSEDEDACSNGGKTSESDPSIEFPLTRRPLPHPYAIARSVTHKKDQINRRRGFNPGDERVTPKPSTDRFISNRISTYDLADTFRSTKATKDLTKSEKLLRDSSATPDAFGRLVLPRVREQSTASSRNRQRLTRLDRARSRTIGTFNAIGLPQDRSAPQNRHVSAGAVWTVGRSGFTAQAGPVRAISNGRGGFLSSGSNAPMYIAEFLDNQTQDQEIETMENRIATALDIDRTERLINTVRTLGEPRSPSTGSIGLEKKRLPDRLQTTWVNGEWVRSCSSPAQKFAAKQSSKAVPVTPFR